MEACRGDRLTHRRWIVRGILVLLLIFGLAFVARELGLYRVQRVDDRAGLLIDYVRRRRAVKRGGEFRLTTLSEDEVGAGLPAAEPLERLSRALDALEEMDPRLANVVDLHFFCGFPLVDIARLRGVTDRTVQSDWRKARLLLQREMDRAGDTRRGLA